MKIRHADPTLVHRPDDGTGLARRVHELAERECASLSPGEMGLCLRQNVAATHIAPLALAVLDRQPFLETDFYPGDLLASLVHAAEQGWLTEDQKAALANTCIRALADADAIQAHAVPVASAYVARQYGTS